MSKMTLNRAVDIVNQLCIRLDCKKCPMDKECTQFALTHKAVPAMYIQTEIKKEKYNGKS